MCFTLSACTKFTCHGGRLRSSDVLSWYDTRLRYPRWYVEQQPQSSCCSELRGVYAFPGIPPRCYNAPFRIYVNALITIARHYSALTFEAARCVKKKPLINGTIVVNSVMVIITATLRHSTLNGPVIKTGIKILKR